MIGTSAHCKQNIVRENTTKQFAYGIQSNAGNTNCCVIECCTDSSEFIESVSTIYCCRYGIFEWVASQYHLSFFLWNKLEMALNRCAYKWCLYGLNWLHPNAHVVRWNNRVLTHFLSLSLSYESWYWCQADNFSAPTFHLLRFFLLCVWISINSLSINTNLFSSTCDLCPHTFTSVYNQIASHWIFPYCHCGICQ